MVNQQTASRIAIQGVEGSYSHLAARMVFGEDIRCHSCSGFEDVFSSVENGDADAALIPLENSTAGRVADVHHLMPGSSLYITAEHFQPVHHALLAPKGATLAGLKRVHSHVHALAQCRRLIQELGITPVVHIDTAGAARDVAAARDPSEAAIASTLAGEIYGLETLRAHVEDASHNTTRFIVMRREPIIITDPAADTITSLLFRLRSVPAALYKALGGFATNGINITRLESYIMDGAFTVAQFYADIEGHPETRAVRLALEELDFFAPEVRILGVYPAHPFRRQQARRRSGGGDAVSQALP